ncbi:MAG: metal ABC transporter solute-binding protein, Zn/Mn family, partial [Lachnospiraceae bacterium]
MKKFGKMRKRITYMTICILLLSFVSGCGTFSGTQSDGDKITIVTTIFPIYDWVREIANGNENVEIILLMDNGADLHSFQPTADDLIQISRCDMFLYVGGESDGWVTDALANATNKDMVVIPLLEALGEYAKEEEIVEGMEIGNEDGHDHDTHAEEVTPENEDAHIEEAAPENGDAHIEEAAPENEDAHIGEAASENEDAHIGEAASENEDAHIG